MRRGKTRIAVMGFFTHVRTFNPRWVITVVAIAVSVVNLLQHRWTDGGVITGHVAEYYRYLPETFYGQAAVKTLEEQDHFHPGIGMAVSYLPFFGMAHLYAKISGAPVDGYSAPYHFFVLFSSLVYFVIGLIFLSKLLRLHFPGLVSSITLLALSLGTNIFYYMTQEGGMPHAVSFMLLVLFLYQVVAWSQARDVGSALQLAILLGVMWTVRPLNILFALVFIFFDARRYSEVQAALVLLIRKPLQLLLIVISCLIVIGLEALYWKWIHGHFVLSYYPGDNFEFSSPAPARMLVSWLFVSPVLLLSLVGLFFLKDSLRIYALAIPVCVIVYLITMSFIPYVAVFGERGLTDMYPLLAIPLGAFIYKLRRLGGWYRRLLYVVIAGMMAWTLWLTFLCMKPA
jgi:hypothetical protein